MSVTTAGPAVALTPRIGSELKISLEALLGGEHRDEIRALLVHRGVPIVRDIPTTDEQHRAFARIMGDLRLAAAKKDGDEGLMKVALDENDATRILAKD